MCFAPQRRALFRHRNFQKWSDNGVFCTFWLGNVLRATDGVQFFISHLASWLRTRRFSEPTFRPSGATNHWKNTVFRDFSYLFTHLHLLSSYSFSSTLLSSDLSLLSASALLCFSSVHIVGSLTSKLPSINVASRASSTLLQPVINVASSERLQHVINVVVRTLTTPICIYIYIATDLHLEPNFPFFAQTLRTSQILGSK